MSREKTAVLLLLLLLLLGLPAAYLTGRDSAEQAAGKPPPEPAEEAPAPPAPPALRPDLAMREQVPDPESEAITTLRALSSAEAQARSTEEARRAANETAAIATLRNISSAQSQFQATARADEDGDGTGEFGTFGELSGKVGIRGGERKLNPPVLPGAFRQVDSDGVVTRSGYHYALYLPRPGGEGLAENGEGGIDAGQVDPDLAEKTYICYAWPIEYGRTGTRTFVVTTRGDVLATDSPGYSGVSAPPPDSAVRRSPGAAGLITGPLQTEEPAPDGNEWEEAVDINIWRQVS